MKPLEDYSDIRGFCYSGGYRVPEEQLKRELGYAGSLRLNSTRIWLSEREYRKAPGDFLKKLCTFVETAWEAGISTMPILFNGNGLDPGDLEQGYEEYADRYVKDVVQALRGEPGLIIWDVMNEPSCNDYILEAEGEERKARWEKVNEFLRRSCDKVRRLDNVNAVTIGHTYMSDVEDTIGEVDVFSFHDYLPVRRQIEESYLAAEELSVRTGKPFLNSELCCLCRANPYDLALDICREHHTGWYLFELMITGYWSDVHGIFYPDGTVRDPSIPAAVLGFRRKRDEGMVFPNANKEGYAQRGVAMVQEALSEKTKVFRAGRKSLDEVLEAAEFCANLLEACELVPMYDPPTARIARIRKAGDEREARKMAYELALLLQEKCQFL